MAERKLATVLFADLTGSTALADEQDPERTRARLERFYDAAAREIESAGGKIEKFAGDAVMAAFGAPGALEDHAERALHAALAMQRQVEAGLGLRIGVNTGEVVAGEARAGSSFVSGDAVNIAARLEQAAEPGEILVGERTVSAVRGAFEFSEPMTVAAKGKPAGIPSRRLRHALSLMRPRGVSGLAGAFVGRDEDLRLLKSAYRRSVENARPVLVTIVGDAGVGKTRLARELWQLLGDEDPQPVRRTGRCLAYGEGITYWPLAEVLKEHLGILESDPPEEVRRRLGDRAILGLTLGLDVAGDLHPLAARDRLHEAWIAFLSELGAEHPVVVLIEDVHWAEEPLLDLLQRLARDVEAPLLLLVTTRPDFLDGRVNWSSPRVASETILLEPLPDESARTLVDTLLDNQVPAEVRELIVERAEGNPFFVEEVVGSLVDQGVLEHVNGTWVAREPKPGFTLPDSVQAVLAARIDLLGEPEKAALQAAAVIGRVFWTGPVYELVGELEPDLRVLEDRDFIRRRGGSSLQGEPEYAFKHALTREVAYGGLPKARRARMHAAFAEWIACVGGGRDEHASLLAHHYAEAVPPQDADLSWQDDEEELTRLRTEALHWLERAAELAVGRYEIDEALTLLHRALELESEEGRRSTLWRKIGHASVLKFDGEAFWRAMEESLATCHDRVVSGDLYAELAVQTVHRSGMWPKRPDRQLVNGWIDKALELSEPESVSRVKALIARCYWNRKAERETARQASELAERLGRAELRSYAFGARTATAFADNDYAESLRWAQRRLELVDDIGDPDHLADLYEMTIPTFCVVGRFAEARAFAAIHDELVANLSIHHRLHGVAVLLEVEEVAGGWDRVLLLADRTVSSVAENLSTPCIRNARSLLVTALAAAYAGNGNEADSFERRAEEVATEGYDFILAAPRARLALCRGEVDRALALLPPIEDDRAVGQTWFALQTETARLDALAAGRDRSTVERIAARFLPGPAYLEPFASRALGVVREDEALVERAIAGFEAMGLDWYAAETRGLL
jgi:class 3 adenylate cyclase